MRLFLLPVIALAIVLAPFTAKADFITFDVDLSGTDMNTGHELRMIGTITLDPDMDVGRAIQSSNLSFTHKEDPFVIFNLQPLPDYVGDRHIQLHGLQLHDLTHEFRARRPIDFAFQNLLDVRGEALAAQASPPGQFTMEGLRDVSNLDHDGHARGWHMWNTCASSRFAPAHLGVPRQPRLIVLREVRLVGIPVHHALDLLRE